MGEDASVFYVLFPTPHITYSHMKFCKQDKYNVNMAELICDCVYWFDRETKLETYGIPNIFYP